VDSRRIVLLGLMLYEMPRRGWISLAEDKPRYRSPRNPRSKDQLCKVIGVLRVERDVMYSLYIRNVGPESCVSELAILRDEALSTGSLSNMDPFKIANRRPK